MSCKKCERMRSHLPEAIRARLAALEKKMEARKQPPVQLSYSLGKQAESKRG